MERAIVIVMDGCGAGEAPDAPDFGDKDHPATIRHVWEQCGPLVTPNLSRAGFLAACQIEGDSSSNARFARLRELSMGKDSVTGHWEMMGIPTEKPFPTYPEGFPISLVKEFERRIGRQTLGNRAASGTAIVDELGEQHMETGCPILYTSADSVFQVACHEQVVPLQELYDMCATARELCQEPNNVQRVIARPFLGEPGSFQRTERRKDFPLPAPRNLIDEIGDVHGVGVVPELFGGRGFRSTSRTQNNQEHAKALRDALNGDARLIFANFEDFDMLFGHRNDTEGFGKALESFDLFLGELTGQLRPDDLLILTADHGNDPTSASTDHSREYVPCCLIGEGLEPANLGDKSGMWAVGATVADHLGIAWKAEASLLR